MRARAPLVVTHDTHRMCAAIDAADRSEEALDGVERRKFQPVRPSQRMK
ncbi:hypothetical protein PXO_02121 [Xanthomonas oryzae pv. oryzae PXO99A]|uniref:Uncharacterized protein n=1 Tax=Xanthomonas oryzae pv. oryzae (strain PXO99A) TaxID=360094 RepID=A0A0K0GN46_XANOP|nr:hypothetical protein PXO_02121 [Xanthomonas oryzae pv. oryzae PXO99A]